MRVVTTRTGQLPSRAQPVPRCRNGMVGKGVPPGLGSNLRMASAAELVDRFFQHELLVSGMGVMADDATLSGDNPVNIGHTIRGFLGHETFLVTMAGQAKSQRAFLDELIPVFLAMGIMAERASADIQGAVDELSG